MSPNKEYTLLINKIRIPVSEEVYKEYYKYKEREAYLDKLAIKNNISFDEYEKKGIQNDYIMSEAQESTEDKLIRKEMIMKLIIAIDKLSEQERMLIFSLFFKGQSERKLSAETGIPQKTINDWKHRILQKLKKFIEK